MRTNIKVTNIVMSDELADYIEKKLAAVEKFTDASDTSVMCDVEVARTTSHHRTGDIFRAEFHLHMAGKYFDAVSEKNTIYAALDEVKDEMVKEVKAYKTKKTTLLKRGSSIIKKMLKRLPL